MDAGVIFGGLLIVLVIAIISIIKNTKNGKKINEALEGVKGICRKQGDSTLYIEGQSELFEALFSINPHRIKHVSYNQEKIHAGSVTVGGVTTGGVYTTGGDYSVHSTTSSRCELIYTDINQYGVTAQYQIKKIVFSDSLLKIAERSAIKEYLNGRTIQIVKDVKLSNYFASLMKAGRNAEAMSQMCLEQNEGYPTREKCEAIINFLCAK